MLYCDVVLRLCGIFHEWLSGIAVVVPFYDSGFLFESQAALPKSYKKIRPGCLYFQLLLSLLFFIAAYSLTAVFFLQHSAF